MIFLGRPLTSVLEGAVRAARAEMPPLDQDAARAPHRPPQRPIRHPLDRQRSPARPPAPRGRSPDDSFHHIVILPPRDPPISSLLPKRDVCMASVTYHPVA